MFRFSAFPRRTSALLALLLAASLPAAGAPGTRPRVLVSTDIGGTDPDDFQSMVHLLVCSDTLAIEGLLSSPYGPGRREHILQVIDHYERDFPHLRTHSPSYPEPAALRALAKQGATDSPGFRGIGAATEGSAWLVQCARRPDPRPLHVLIWGGIEDLAQALHDAPDILPRLRVYFIGGPNKMWSVDAYHYLETHHPSLWLIEANATYRGWFVGGNQEGDWGNRSFVTARIAGRGALGDFFATQLRGVIKMGDSPSVTWALQGPERNPAVSGWGGRFVPIWDGRRTVFERLTSESDVVEVFGVVEFALPLPAGTPPAVRIEVQFDRRVAAQTTHDGKTLRFRFSPRDAKVWTFEVRSDLPTLAGWGGSFTATPPPAARTAHRSTLHPHWWIDDPDPAAAEGIHPGAHSVSRWREAFLRDFAERLERCARPRSSPR